jgi:hypothetical protein
MVAAVRVFLPDGAIKLENRADAALEDFLGFAVLVVLAAAQLTFDLHVSAFLQSCRETGDFAVGHAAVPFGSGFPRAVCIFPRGLRRYREER